MSGLPVLPAPGGKVHWRGKVVTPEKAKQDGAKPEWLRAAGRPAGGGKKAGSKGKRKR